ncbi:hypothetical protein [Vibrio parahaemolyticus]|uniref:hypothetical protein n=1 Tax=Vibrio parahaemolyticus TaxID=670 RepID=UPI000812C34B|nr:hypothetical protein [Vibrio parahaemolyticus]OCP68301.1 hypothetical protein AKH08_15915 [Vibrio parahaemolyticus]
MKFEQAITPSTRGLMICCGDRLDAFQLVGHQLINSNVENLNCLKPLVLNICQSDTETLTCDGNVLNTPSVFNLTVSPFGDFKHYKHALSYVKNFDADVLSVSQFDELSDDELCLLAELGEHMPCIANSQATTIHELIEQMCSVFDDKCVADLISTLAQTNAVICTSKRYQTHGYCYKHVTLKLTTSIQRKLKAQHTVKGVKKILLTHASKNVSPLVNARSLTKIHQPAA